MVAPVMLSRPTRMFACLTFTGEDKTLPAVCCDLSRVASIVPAYPLPKNLVASNGLHRGNTAPKTANLNTKTLDKNMTAVMRQQFADIPSSCEQQSNASTDHESVSTTTTSTVSIAADSLSVFSESSKKRTLSEVANKPAKIRKIDSNTTDDQLNSKAGRKKRIAITKREASSLLAENELLKLQNDQLKKQMLTYQMILKTEENYDFAVKKIRALQMQSVQQSAAATAASK